MRGKRASVEQARALRRRQTDSERKLWAALRSRQFGARIRRQQPIGKYIVDFFCPEAKLIIELDGGQHNTERAQTRDDNRTAWLQSEGYRVLRFWNPKDRADLDAIIETIWHAVTGRDNPSPQPSPPRGEGAGQAQASNE